jgi:sigma-B regulation protein RsbU (phosphoserine phosphatase)
MPVGMIEEATFELGECRLSAGDQVVVYSDGVTEAQNGAGDFFGRKRLLEAVTGRAARGCRAVHDAIQASVTGFTEGTAQSDDVTVLVMEYGGR